VRNPRKRVAGVLGPSYAAHVHPRGPLDLFVRRLYYWPDDLRWQFYKRGPWVTRFTVRGRAYGGWYDCRGDQRIARFLEHFGDCQHVLELGSLEGGHTFELAAQGLRVTAVEGRPENAERARWVQQLLGVDSVEFVVADLETTPLREFGVFDAVMCSGLLYHLPRPWELLDQLADVAPRTLISTHYASHAEAESEGIPGSWWQEDGRANPTSGLSERSFWLTPAALTSRLQQNGYDVRMVDDEPNHPNGPLLTLVATR
jgi:SAM-dependent methyltransferase